MSEKVQKSLSAFMKSQMSKKSSKKDEPESKPVSSKKSDLEVEKQKQKMLRDEARKESNSKLSEVNKWAMYRRLIWEYILQLSMTLAYCIVFGIAMMKFGLMILTFIQNFLHEIFVPVVTKG